MRTAYATTEQSVDLNTQMAVIIPPFPSFDVNPESGALDTWFKKYTARFRNLVVAADITDPARQKALLLH